MRALTDFLSRHRLLASFAILALVATVQPGFAEDAAPSEPGTEAIQPTATDAPAAEEKKWDGTYDAAFIANNLWVMIAGMLVFIMHLGFATVESGFTRSKNTVNILFKNCMIICIGLITYGILGFNLMYPGFGDTGQKFLKFAGFGFLANGTNILEDASQVYTGYHEAYTIYTDFFFQAMFAATCCTIVSGAVAGRIKLATFLVFATLFVSLCYPITGSWKWGGGWLDARETPFYDFAGSTLVHSVGGWGALVMAFLLGPRNGKFVDGKAQVLPGSNMPLATIGVMLLWFGWFGFNGGSVLSANPGSVSLVLVTTSLAAAAGGIAGALTSWIHSGKPDLSMCLNGMLAGLVGITAGADLMNGLEAIAIGLIAGVLVYSSVLFVDNVLKVDDPVGAISVHLVCGIWGTLVCGIFGKSKGGAQLTSQIIGIVAIGLFTVVFVGIVGSILKATMGLRVSDEEQEHGLDIGEHGMEAYSIR